jgi:hypothetical protein
MTTNDDIIDYTKFEPENLIFTKPEENSRSKGQLIGFSRYHDSKNKRDKELFLQTCWLELNDYGIPQLGEFFKSDSDRDFIKIPCNLNNPECLSMVNKFKRFDEILSSKDKKDEFFGKKGKNYNYVPVFREIIEDIQDSDDEEDTKKKNTKKKVKQPYIKFKLNISYTTKENETIIYSSVKENEKRVRTRLENIKSIDDIARVVPYMSKIRCIIKPVKLWAQPATKKDPQYGITFKVYKIEVEPPNNSYSISKTILDSDNFIDSDDEDNEIPTINTTSNTTTINTTTINTTTINTTSDDESDDELQPVSTTIVDVSSDEDEPVHSSQILNVDTSDSESEEEVKPKRKPSKKSTKK